MAGWRAWAASHFFRVCQNRSTLPWVWGWFGLPFFCRTPRFAQLGFEGVAAAAAAGEPGGVDHAVVGQVEAGAPWAAPAARNAASTAGPVTGWWRGHRQRVPGMVIEPGQDLGVGAAGEPVVGEV